MPVQKPAPQEDPRKRKFIAFAVLVAVAAGAYLLNRKVINPPPAESKRVTEEGVFSGTPTPASSSNKPFESMGVFAADEVLRVIGNSGTIALVREVPDPNTDTTGQAGAGWKATAAQLDSFKEWLKQNGRFTFLPETQLVRPENAITPGWAANQFGRVLQGAPANTTIIVYCALPEPLTENDKAILRTRNGKVIVIGSIETVMKPLVHERLIHLAVTMRVPSTPRKDGETAAQFARRIYTVLKPGAPEPLK